MLVIPVGLMRGDMAHGVYEDEDLNDFERQQDMHTQLPVDVTEEPEEDDSIELSLYGKPYRIENWDREDLMMYVGGDKELYR